jgi:plastocyanin
MKPPVALFAFAAVAALGRPAAPQVTIKTFAFGPKTLDVPAGTTVVWTNADDIEHTVTSGMPDQPDGRFDHPLATKGATASVRFDSAGTWSYFCKRHSFMRGEIRVTPKGER